MSEETTATQPQKGYIEFPCEACGGLMQFEPTSQAVTCIYCGHEMRVPQNEGEVEEQDLLEALHNVQGHDDTLAETVVSCGSCGAETTLDPSVQSDQCPFCGTPVVATAHTENVIRPKSLLPFGVSREDSVRLFKKWLKSLWFAPSALKHTADDATGTSLNGIYVPHWTYDANTVSHYTGQRGDDYWETQHYTTTENGKSVRKTRRVRKTRWHHVSGVVYQMFDDILVLASESLPKKYAEKLEPWDLQNLVPFEERYLAGFRTERYHVSLEDGFERACGVMDSAIRVAINHDIGGDHQRIHSVQTRRQNLKYKHILLPVWLSAYRWKGKPYRFMVNARTGEVQGERPWSALKITLAVLGVVAIGVGIYLAVNA
jgi:DNA-directed RNA polymerase subunit RPC12/RpoP